MFRKIVIVTLIFSDVVPQLNITFSFKLSFERPLCCLANYFLSSLFSFQGATFPTSLDVRSQNSIP